MHKIFLLSGTVLGGLSVAIGAFGAHKLKPFLLENNKLSVFETGVQYQFYHALALILVGILAEKIDHPSVQYAGYAMLWGTIIFSFSLYALCLTGVTKLGAITPIGGLLLILGWVSLLIGIIKKI
ncbi:MAG: hypothetical protein RL060_1736 [Bacteroidota bacterium]|jgi:uncharacterized membrane protein YgdD (TMEM256/DUF423 family)